MCRSVVQCVAVSVTHFYVPTGILAPVHQCVAVCYDVLQRVAVCCSDSFRRSHRDSYESSSLCCSVLQCVVIGCRVLQCVAVWYSVWRCHALISEYSQGFL